MDINPILVEAIRGDMTESVHRGSFAVVDSTGHVVLSVGDVEKPVFPRSGLKPVQALLLIESGAAKAFHLAHAQIALACASHNGEAAHVEIIANWLDRIGLSENQMVCGNAVPATEKALRDFHQADEVPSPLYDNCSGKHAAFMTTALHLGHPVETYARLDHPVQQRLLGIMEQMTGIDLFEAPKGIDGCGIPVFGIPLGNLALAMARLGDPHDQSDTRQAACRRVRKAMAAEPFLIGGSGRFCSRVIAALGEAALVKTGAEGLYCATLTNLGLGVAIKIEDGARRAAEAVMIRVLEKLDVLTERAKGQLLNLREPPIFSRSGEVVGVLKITEPSLTL
jgi:L-asparaginase II